MAFFDYASLSGFVQTHGYFIIFLLMVVEGPITTTAAAFAASLGFFNVYIILVLAIVGDIIGDTLYFWIGRTVRASALERYGKYIGVKLSDVKRLEGHLKRHFAKTLFIVKMTPIAGACIVLMGALKSSYWRFIKVASIIIVFRAIGFVVLGFFFGWAVSGVLQYFKWGEYSALAIAIAAVIIYFVLQRVSRQARSKL